MKKITNESIFENNKCQVIFDILTAYPNGLELKHFRYIFFGRESLKNKYSWHRIEEELSNPRYPFWEYMNGDELKTPSDITNMLSMLKTYGYAYKKGKRYFVTNTTKDLVRTKMDLRGLQFYYLLERQRNIEGLYQEKFVPSFSISNKNINVYSPRFLSIDSNNKDFKNKFYEITSRINANIEELNKLISPKEKYHLVTVVINPPDLPKEHYLKQIEAIRKKSLENKEFGQIVTKMFKSFGINLPW